MTYSNKSRALTLLLLALSANVFAQDAATAVEEGAEATADATEATADVTADVAADPALAAEQGLDQVAEGSGEEDLGAMDSEAPPLLSDEQATAEEELQGERSGTDPYEYEDRSYYFIGAFYNHSFIPGFMLSLFLDAYQATNNPTTGLEFTYRRNGFDIMIRGYWQRFAVDGPFRGPGDADFETEIINANMQTAMLSATFLWGTQFNKYIGLQFGIGLGIGGAFGDLIRTEAYPDSNAESGYSPCTGPSNPNASYCDPTSVADGENGGHYNVPVRNWANGGSLPFMWFRASIPHLAIRIKPIKQLLIRVEGGFDVFSGFFVGGSLGFGFGGGSDDSPPEEIFDEVEEE